MINWTYDFRQKIGMYWYFFDCGKLVIYRSTDPYGKDLKGKDTVKQIFSGSASDCKEFLIKMKENQNVKSKNFSLTTQNLISACLHCAGDGEVQGMCTGCPLCPCDSKHGCYSLINSNNSTVHEMLLEKAAAKMSELLKQLKNQNSPSNFKTIDCFRDYYFFLSNFYHSKISFSGLVFENNEAAFQSAKTLNFEVRKEFCKLPPNEAKRKGRHVNLRTDWETVKVGIMKEIVYNKFSQNAELTKMLLATDNAFLIEGNTWNDTFWGICEGKGKNLLGRILMETRQFLRESI